MKHEPGNRVTFKDSEGRKRSGRVTSVEPQRRRVKTDDGNLVSVSVRQLREAHDQALLLETRLDSNLQSKRGDGVFLEEFFKPHKVKCLYERVHSKENLRYFLGFARRTTSNVRWVHYLGHGSTREGSNKCQLDLTAGKLLLPEDLEVFAGLPGKTLIFSCCDVGRCPGVMEQILGISGAEAVYAYNGEVYDHTARVGDTALYGIMLNEPHLKPQTVAQRVNQILRLVGTDFEGKQRLLRVVSR